MTFALGTLGFFSLMWIAPALMRWCEYNPWFRYKAAAFAVVGSIGFGSAALLSGWNIPQADLDRCWSWGGRSDQTWNC